MKVNTIGKKKPKFKKGNVCFSVGEDERLFILKYIKKIKPKNEFEKRARQRLARRLMGLDIARFPLYPEKECSICGRDIAGKVFDRHVTLCKLKRDEAESQPDIDPAVFEMLG